MNLLGLAKKKIDRSCNVKSFRHAAIAFLPNGHILATEANRKGNGDISDFSMHAEEMLAKKLMRMHVKERIGRFTVLVARYRKADNSWAMSLPCLPCQGWFWEAGCDTIQYTGNDGKIRKLGS